MRKGSISAKVQRRLDLHNQGKTIMEIMDILGEPDYFTVRMSIIHHTGGINRDKLGRPAIKSNRLLEILQSANRNGYTLTNAQLAERLNTSYSSIGVLKHRLINKGLLPANNPSP